jgi:glycosyltransferase involved in cell wall biosynthesis
VSALELTSADRHLIVPMIDLTERTWELLGPSGESVEVTVSVVIPTRNEALNLPYVLPQIPVGVQEILVVDGDSSDGTPDLARALRPEVRIVQQPGQGKGDALRAGFCAAQSDIIVMLDADGSMSPLEIPRYVDALVAGADVVTGSRNLDGGGSADITPIREFGNDALGWAYKVMYGRATSDLCYGFMAFWRRVVPMLHLDADGFEIETLVNVRSALAGLTVAEVPSREARRLHGNSNLRTIRDGVRVLRTLTLERAKWLASPSRRTAIAAGVGSRG